jgi:hypothetical protein
MNSIPYTHEPNGAGVVDDDFMPTLNQLLYNSRTARTRRALSLKLLTLLLQDDATPPEPTPLANTATRPDTDTKWGARFDSVPGIASTGTATNMPTVPIVTTPQVKNSLDLIAIEAIRIPLKNVTTLMKDFSGYDVPIDEVDMWSAFDV